MPRVSFGAHTVQARQSEARTTVFKRAVDVSYKLRRKTSRGLLSEVNKNHPTLPFTLRSLQNATQAKAGVIECTRHELLHEYPVLKVKDGASHAPLNGSG